MLTKRENLLETIRGGHPDRFVNQYEAFNLTVRNPYAVANSGPGYGEPPKKNLWGVTRAWPVGTPGVFPVHDQEHIVVKDITEWQKYVKVPHVQYSAEEWEPFIKQAEEVDRKEEFVTHLCAPGIFEQLHNLQEIQNCLINFYEEPEATQELIDCLVEWELEYAEVACRYLKPDSILHHDDWGSQISTFLSPDMFEEFLLPGYKKVYGYYKSHGVEVIVHHSDSYAETLVPFMIEMGIDIWQGVMTTNNIPAFLEKYGGQISLMGGIDSASVDYEGWTQEVVHKEVFRACKECGIHYFIPNASQGLPMSTFPGVYEALSEEIDKASKELGLFD